MKRTKQAKPMGERQRTVMRVTNREILTNLELLLMEVRSAIVCRRRPGIQIGIDALLQFWFKAEPAKREAFLKQWETPVIGYPNSLRPNPGQFARVRDVQPPEVTE